MPRLLRSTKHLEILLLLAACAVFAAGCGNKRGSTPATPSIPTHTSTPATHAERHTVVLWQQEADPAQKLIGAFQNTWLVSTPTHQAALSIFDGHPLWSQPLPHDTQVVAPVAGENFGAFRESSGHITLFSLADGKPIWRSPSVSDRPPLLTPTQTFVIWGNDGSSEWVDPKDTAHTTRTPISWPGPVSEMAANDDFIAAVCSGAVYCCDRTSGQIRWSVSARTLPIQHIEFVDAHRFLSQTSVGLICRDSANGQIVWRCPHQGDPILGLQVQPRRLFLWSRSELQEIDASTGKLNWRFPLTEPMTDTLKTTADACYLTERSQILCISPFSGRLRWSVALAAGTSQVAPNGFLLSQTGHRLQALARVPPEAHTILQPNTRRGHTVVFEAQEAMQSELRGGWYLCQAADHHVVAYRENSASGWKVTMESYDHKAAEIRFRITAPTGTPPGQYVFVNEGNGSDGGGVSYRFSII